MHPEPEVNLEALAKEALKLWAKNVDPAARPEPVLHPITGGMSGAAYTCNSSFAAGHIPKIITSVDLLGVSLRCLRLLP